MTETSEVLALRPSEPGHGPLKGILRATLLVGMLYLFLVAIKLLESAIKLLGEDGAQQLFAMVSNPFAGLAVGILATVLVQSSSVTTSAIVGMVGSGELPMGIAVPMIFGANIGTSITNTLVSMAHMTRSQEFHRAFAGATVHDLFNLLTVAVMLPLELSTGVLQKASAALVDMLPHGGEAARFESPIKAAVKWLAGWITAPLEAIGLEGGWLSATLFLISIGMIIATLILITKNMRDLMADRIEAMLNRVLMRSGMLGVAIGIVITVLVQSSSITTSLLVPMFGAGVLTLEAGFPIMVGANIGTTITALLASTAADNISGLQIALVHLLFNGCGTVLFFVIRPMRNVPISLSRRLADLAITNRLWVLVYLFVTFFGLPMLGLLIWRH
jgi:sodium-dependent phosphate cotransporter